MTSVIIGPRDTAQIEDNVASLAIELSEDERPRSTAPPGSSTVPYYLKNPEAWQPQRFR